MLLRIQGTALPPWIMQNRFSSFAVSAMDVDRVGTVGCRWVLYKGGPWTCEHGMAL